MTKILAVDPGTDCGWCVMEGGKIVASGTWDLKAKRHEGGGMRYLRFERYFLEALFGVNLVAYEEVRRHMGVDAAPVYGGIIAVLAKVCEAAKVPYFGLPVATVKRHACKNGAASKEMMVDAANKQYGLALKYSQDDEADAIWIAATAESQYGGK